MRNVPKTFDGGDIDNHGHWVGAEMSCLECHETAEVRMGLTATYMLAAIECRECGEVFAEVWQ
jgi:transcription elongation factor Elf1